MDPGNTDRNQVFNGSGSSRRVAAEKPLQAPNCSGLSSRLSATLHQVARPCECWGPSKDRIPMQWTFMSFPLRWGGYSSFGTQDDRRAAQAKLSVQLAVRYNEEGTCTVECNSNSTDCQAINKSPA